MPHNSPVPGGRTSTTGEAPARASNALVVTTLSLCGIVASLQQTVLFPLLPQLPDLLDVSSDSASWLVTATLLTGAVTTPIISRLADMHGKRRMMLIVLSISVLGSVVGAVGEAFPLLICARALQGVGLALIPVGIAIMRDELPRAKVALGVAIMSATLAIGAAAGPPVAGLIFEHLTWHAIFWLTGLVGALLVVAAAIVLPESPVRTGGTFDLRGAVLLSVALAALLLALTKGAQWGWLSPEVLGLAVVGAGTLAVWFPMELRTPCPLVALRVARRPAVLLVNIVSVLSGFAMFVNVLLTAMLLQMPTSSGYGLGMDVLHTGLWLMPNAVAFGLAAPASAWVTGRFGPRVTLLAGVGIMAVAYVGRVFWSADLTQIMIGTIVISVGTALAYGALPMLVMRAVPVTETASANGLSVLLRSIGTSTASASTAVITSGMVVVVDGQSLPSLGGLHLVFWIAAGTALISTAVTIPMLGMPDFSEGADRSGVERIGAESVVVHGQVIDVGSRPIRSAVVSVLTPTGEAVDWGPADSQGRFVAAIPTATDYLVVTAAEGWRPRSRIMSLDGDQPLPPIVLRDRLTVVGTITDAEGAPVPDSLVVLTRHSGEVVASIRTDRDGHYQIPRPPHGRHVLTVVARDGAIGARPATIWEGARTIDLTLGTPLV